MKAVVKARAEPGLWLEEVPVPEVRGDDVLIRVLKTSICGTDVHIHNWDAWAKKTIPVPMTIGHEFVGVVDLVAVSKSLVTFVLFRNHFGARDTTIFSKRGSPRSGSQNGSRRISP
jgi:threonine dehydrogenase-like Zn-dependent dehydrogenase